VAPAVRRTATFPPTQPDLYLNCQFLPDVEWAIAFIPENLSTKHAKKKKTFFAVPSNLYAVSVNKTLAPRQTFLFSDEMPEEPERGQTTPPGGPLYEVPKALSNS